MKNKIALSLGALIVLNALPAASQDTLRVLFIGNSYTYTNDLPGLFTNLAVSGGRPLMTAMSAPGGYTLEGHTTNSTTLFLINQGGWDYVILQEQSQYPTIPYYRENSFYPSSRILDSVIVSNGEQTAFFMTWGRKHGGQQTINQYSSYPFANFFQMQDTLAAAYAGISAELEATLCPIGLAWAQAVSLDSTIDLWQSDGSHPTLLGSYLAACVIYSVLCNANPIGLTYTGGLSLQLAAFLQYAAWISVTYADIAPPPIHMDFQIQVSPNPFNSKTAVRYDLLCASWVKVEVYDTMGRRVTTLAEGWQNRGLHDVAFEGSNLASGMYFLRLQGGKRTEVRKLTLLR